METERNSTEVITFEETDDNRNKPNMQFPREMIQRVLTVKDEGCVSDKSYHELKMVKGVNLPPLAQLKVEQAEMEGLIPLHEIDKVFSLSINNAGFLVPPQLKFIFLFFNFEIEKQTIMGNENINFALMNTIIRSRYIWARGEMQPIFQC